MRDFISKNGSDYQSNQCNVNKNKKLKIAIITNIIPTYREGFYDRIFSVKDFEIRVFCQDRIPGFNLVSVHKKYGEKVRLIKYLAVSKEKIVWQFVPWFYIVRNYDVVFISGNPRVLSDVIFSLFLLVLRKPVVLWTTAHSFRNNKFTEKIRLSWSRVFKNIFVYTDYEVQFLKKAGFENNYILGMNNGLDQKGIDEIASKWMPEQLGDWRVKNGLSEKKILLSCARLESKNKFDQVIKALPLILKKFPEVIWCLIGAGDEKRNLKMLASNLKVEDKIIFAGSIYNETELAPWFLSSELFVHPAAIGLSLNHAMGYGLPVITHGIAELHNPEYAAFKPGLTGSNFRIDDINSLAEAVTDLLSDLKVRQLMKKNALHVARNEYNIDIMVSRFSTIARHSSNVENKHA